MELQAILLILCAIDSARSQCPAKMETTITDTSGRITTSALRNRVNCDHSWIFPNIPNNVTMLVLNMTTAPLYKDVIKLDSDDFIDDDKFKYCKVLEMNTRTLEGSLETLERIHKEFPGCKLRSGVSPGVTLTYDAQEGFIGSTYFVIEYKIVRSFSEPQPTLKAVETHATSASSTDTQPTAKPVETPAAPATTVALKDKATQTRVMTNVTAQARQEENFVPLTSKLAIILGTLGGIVLVLLILLMVVLIVRKRRTKSNVSKDDHQLSNLYQAIPEISSSGDANGQIYNEITSTRTSKKHTDDKTQYGGIVTRQKSARDVINPLYESQESEKHSYEYIEVRIPQNREREERSAM